MSAYRIFINNLRVATAVPLESGEFLQVYPSKRVFPCKEQWASDTFWDNREGAPRSYTMEFADGSRVTYGQEKYKLFHDGKCASVGFRVGDAYIQRYPYFAGGTRIQLISERAPLFGVETCLYVKAKLPTVTAPPEPVAKMPRISWQQRLGLGKWSNHATQEPKERVSRWAKMTDSERQAWKERMALARRQAKERREEFAALRALGRQSIIERQQEEVQFISALDVMRSQGLAEDGDHEDSYYGEDDFQRMHPSIAMVFRALTQSHGAIRKSNEGCECGNC